MEGVDELIGFLEKYFNMKIIELVLGLFLKEKKALRDLLQFKVGFSIQVFGLNIS